MDSWFLPRTDRRTTAGRRDTVVRRHPSCSVLKDMIDFYHSSLRRLDSGLYVAYLRMQNSIDCARVMVSKSMVGSLPCHKVRSISNVSK